MFILGLSWGREVQGQKSTIPCDLALPLTCSLVVSRNVSSRRACFSQPVLFVPSLPPIPSTAHDRPALTTSTNATWSHDLHRTWSAPMSTFGSAARFPEIEAHGSSACFPMTYLLPPPPLLLDKALVRFACRQAFGFNFGGAGDLLPRARRGRSPRLEPRPACSTHTAPARLLLPHGPGPARIRLFSKRVRQASLGR